MIKDGLNQTRLIRVKRFQRFDVETREKMKVCDKKLNDGLDQGGQPAAHWTVSGGALQLGKIFQMKNIA